MAGSVRSTFASRVKHTAADVAKGDEIIVTPALLPFNTDTVHYWRLSPNIFRYNHGAAKPSLSSEADRILIAATRSSTVSPDDFFSTTSLHSVNEALRATGFVELIRAFGTIIANGDELPYNL